MGHPELPGTLLRFALPPEADLGSVSVDLISATLETVPGSGYDLSLAPLYASSDGIAPESLEMAAAWEPASYAPGEYYGREAWSFVAAQQGGRWKVLEVEYTPFAYQPVSGELTVTTDIELTVSFNTDEPLPLGWASNRGTDEHIAGMVENFDAALPLYEAAAAVEADSLGADPGTGGIGEDIAIITTNAIRAGSSVLSDFVDHKQSRAYDVFIWDEDDWGGGTGGTAANNIRDFLDTNYGTYGLDYVILIGNPHPSGSSAQRVPMRSMVGGPSDYYFADLTWDWDYDNDGTYGEWDDDMLGSMHPLHELQVGRIPCYGNYTELDSILQKIIDYETEVSTGWRNAMLNATAISNFNNQDYSGNPQCLGWTLAENIRDDLAIPEGYTSWEMWERSGLAYPTPVPDNSLTQALFVDEWATDDDYAFVNYWGHGNSGAVYRTIWNFDDGDGVAENAGSMGDEISGVAFYDNGDCSTLDDDHPSFVSMIACTNGYPESSNNLGYETLLSGGIGVVSGSRTTMYAVVDWYDTLWSSYGDNASYAYKMTERMTSGSSETTETMAEALQWCRENMGDNWVRRVGRTV